MRTTESFIKYLHNLDISLWSEGEDLFFNAPKGVMTPELKTELSERKQEVLIFIQTANAISRSEVKPLKKRVRDKKIPLSFAQERLWFLNQLVPDNPFYNMPIAIGHNDRIDIPALMKSIRTIISRHEALRTRFKVKNGEPEQIIEQSIPTLPYLIDLKHIPDSERKKESNRIIFEESILPFDLENDSVIRAKLLLAEMENVLLITIHHIASDGWSMGILEREISELYPAFSNEEPYLLPELPIQYADFAVWQREWL